MKSFRFSCFALALAGVGFVAGDAHALVISNIVHATGSIVISNGVVLTAGLWEGRMETRTGGLDADRIASIVGPGSIVISNLVTLDVLDNELVFTGDLADSYAGTMLPVEGRAGSDLLLGYRSSSHPKVAGDSIFLGLSGPGDNTGFPWFVVDISGWNGEEELLIQNFWSEEGGVTSFGLFTGRTTGTAVPDGGGGWALLIAGLAGLVGLGAAHRPVGCACHD
jgi:hypothetical protein